MSDKLEKEIRNILDGHITPDGMAKIGDARDEKEFKELQDFDDALERVLDEIRNPPQQKTAGASSSPTIHQMLAELILLLERLSKAVSHASPEVSKGAKIMANPQFRSVLYGAKALFMEQRDPAPVDAKPRAASEHTDAPLSGDS